MREFAAFILTHGRPDKVVTYKKLRDYGYSGRIVLVVDNEDKTVDQYRETYGSQVEIFDKAAVAAQMDRGDNFQRLDTVVFARHACFDIAKSLGITHFVQLDDDYRDFRYRFNDKLAYCIDHYKIHNLDRVFELMCDFVDESGVKTIAMSQGGDYIGGPSSDFASHVGSKVGTKRKAMNSFVCRTDNRIDWVARMNDDVTTYAINGTRGDIFLTANQVGLDQGQTQQNSGGLTEMYLAFGTYVKSFYTVMFHPSGCRVQMMNSRSNPRLHHQITWAQTAPKILPESLRKKPGEKRTKRKELRFQSDVLLAKPKADRQQFLKLCARAGCTDLKRVNTIIERNPAVLSGTADPNLRMSHDIDRAWYDALDRGEIDYSIYTGEDYLAELWTCWASCSRKNLLQLMKENGMADGQSVLQRIGEINSVLDLGCGFGKTTAALTELYPKAQVIGTNLPGSIQYEAAKIKADKYAFDMLHEIPEQNIDLVFASEYFEHLEDPFANLQELVEKTSAKWLIIANAFNTRAPGHFLQYNDGEKIVKAANASKRFNSKLRSLGYRKVKTKLWNNRPAIWKRSWQN